MVQAACCAVAVILAVCGCGGSGGGTSSPSSILFTSDQSVILPSMGSTYQFAAMAGSGRAISWTSSDPQTVSVSPSGLVTAKAQSGSATISLATEGVATATAFVVVAAPGPKTILINSADVLSNSGTSITLTPNAATKAIVVGDYVVSGSKARILGKVTAASITAQAVSLQLTQASLVSAFPDLSIHLLGSPITATLEVSQGKAALVQTNGARVALTREGSGFTCTDSNGAAVNTTLSGPSFNAPVQVQLEATLDSHGFTAQDFSLIVHISIPASIKSGSVTFVASGQTSFACVAETPNLEVPAVDIGPIVIDGSISGETTLAVTASANGTLTLTGPSVSDTFSGTDGISWSQSAGWSSVTNNTSTGPTFNPPGFKFTAQVGGSLTASFRVNEGISASLTDLTLATADLAYAEIGGALKFNMSSPLAYMTSGYMGPTWNEELDLSAGPEIKVSGPVVDLLNELGLPTPNVSWELFKQPIPLGNSPTPTLAVSSATITAGNSETFTVTAPAGYAEATVSVYAFPTPGSPFLIGSKTLDSKGSATVTWTPSGSQDGTYNVQAVVFGDVFGTLGFPYPANSVSVKVGGGNVGVSVQ